ncbi:MAG: alkaline phosphatase family protein [Planctomycetota bacterium]|nr:alkaline phosphatase family protein [Planctomycetota bacterium]
MKNAACFLLLLMPIMVGCSSTPSHRSGGATPSRDAEPNRRVLFLALDGFRSDALLRHAPHLRAFGEKNLATWNSKVAIPISAPSWCTIFSGLSQERTGVTNNAFTGKNLKSSDNNLAKRTEKTIFHHLRENRRDSAVVSTGTWDGIEKIANYSFPLEKNVRTISPNNRPHNELAAQEKGIAVALEYIDSPGIDFVTFYTHHIDNSGHMFGHDPDVFQYATAIRQTDANLVRLFRAVEERERNHGEEWLVLISTDHGGSSRWKLEGSEAGLEILSRFDVDKQINAGIPQNHLEGIHGLQNDDVIGNEQTTTFIIMSQGGKRGSLGEGWTNRDITPTILDYLLPGKKDLLKKLDGKSFLVR